MSDYLDEELEKWAISNVCHNTGIVQTEYEMRAVKLYMAQGFMLLSKAQPAIDTLRSENARLQKAVDDARVILKDLFEFNYPHSFCEQLGREWLATNPKESE